MHGSLLGSCFTGHEKKKFFPLHKKRYYLELLDLIYPSAELYYTDPVQSTGPHATSLVIHGSRLESVAAD